MVMTMTENKPAAISSIHTASTARWLATVLATARAEAKAAPPPGAVERIRARVFGEASGRKHTRTLAA